MSSKQVKVSIIIPTYNNARYIAQTISSVLEQSYTNWELVIVDDGSDDDTADVVRPYLSDKVRYLPQPRRGVELLAETMNVGLQATSGPLVTMLGSDDLWPPQRLEVQVPMFAGNEVVLCFGRGVLIDAQGRRISSVPIPSFVEPVMNRPVGTIMQTLLLGNWLPQYTVLIRRSGLEQLGGYIQPDDLLAEDYPTHLELARLGEFRFVDAELGFYRIHAGQQTRNRRLDMRRRDARWVLRYYDELPADLRARIRLDRQDLEKSWDFASKNAYFEEGRYALLSGDRFYALAQFSRALVVGRFRTKVKAVVGLLCGITGVSLEWVGSSLGRSRVG